MTADWDILPAGKRVGGALTAPVPPVPRCSTARPELARAIERRVRRLGRARPQRAYASPGAPSGCS